MAFAFFSIFVMVTIVALLLSNKVAPIVVLVIVPIVGAIFAGFQLQQIADFAMKGLLGVAPLATLFIFAILFFSIVREAGIFEPLIDKLVSFAGDRVTRVTMATSLIAIVAHLEGIGAATLLITIPTLLPVYNRLKMDKYDLLFLTAISAGVVNFAPWGGPVGRASLGLHLDPVLLWKSLVPAQIFGVVSVLLLAYYVGKRAEAKLKAGAILPYEIAPDAVTDKRAEPARVAKSPMLYWSNVTLTLIAIVTLLTTKAPPTIVFLIALTLALLLNFRSPKVQVERLKAHSSDALYMGALLMAAGSFLGVVSSTGMLTSITDMIVAYIPSNLTPYVHFAAGFFSLPLGIFFSPDAFYLGLMPVINGISSHAGVPSLDVAKLMTLGEAMSFAISPASASTYLAVGLAGCELGKFMRRSLGWFWLVGIGMFFAGCIM